MQYTILFSLMTTGLIQLFKWLPFISLTEGQRERTRKVVAVCSFISGLGGAYLNGSLAQPEVGQMYADIILYTLTACAMSHGW
jgi:hypothetical protein